MGFNPNSLRLFYMRLKISETSNGPTIYKPSLEDRSSIDGLSLVQANTKLFTLYMAKVTVDKIALFIMCKAQRTFE
ncbi:hypothetical protein [Microbulbifer sp. THAF38]|uniref:hypothetical protein n=1 Tax=Microbulbifer sp. THAF38 TaxID=2587856 RepID=UPI0012678F11|nr:hypothetical protein [Microbulbifer sp. THAF38]QFT53770.1 hypothetical protein FIU95_04175 [Microbulbifer sp. THAF38]